MINLVRRLLRNSPFYLIAAQLYHLASQTLMRLNLLFSSTKYLPPIKPRHEFRSQFGQDYYLEKMGLLVSNGFFVEVGGNHPIHNSNSHYLEKQLGWSGVSIDAIDYGSLYKSERKNTIFINALVSNREDELDFFRVRDRDGWENQVSSIHKETLGMGKGFEAEVVKMRSVPISKIKEINRPIDLCLIDVEGHELEVLQSIDFNNNAPSVLVVENNGQFYNRKSLVSFLKGKRYYHVARIGTSDDIFVLKDTMQTAKHTIAKRK